MNDDAAQRPWLVFRIAGSDPGGVDARDLARLLAEIVSSARAIAEDVLALGRRPGPMSKLERSLAAFRVVSVLPGSVEIVLAQPPPPDEATESLLEDRDLTPGIVALEFFEAFEGLLANPPPRSEVGERRHAVECVVRSAARIGDHAEIVHYPTDGGKLHVAVPLGDGASARLGRGVEARRVVYGRVFADDASGAPQRLRVHLTDGSEAMMRPSKFLTHEVLAVCGKLAELHVSGSTTNAATDGVIAGIRVLDRPRPRVAHPPKSIEQLAREHGLLSRPPADYPSLFAGLFGTEAEAEAFREDIRHGRSASR